MSYSALDTGSAPDALIQADWSIEKMFTNATSVLNTLGGSFLMLVGLICVIAAVVFIAQKLLSEQSRRSWVTVVLLIVFGGAMIAGGISMFVNIAAGTHSTIEQLGNGLILF